MAARDPEGEAAAAERPAAVPAPRGGLGAWSSGRRRWRDRVVARFGARLLRLLVRSLGASARVHLADPAAVERLRIRSEPAILVLWHRQLFLCSYLLHRELVRRGLPLTVLISRSRDGDIGTRLGELLGARIVRGSSSRGGGAALRQLCRVVADGGWPVMIPDGPRGPAGVAKTGPVALARLTGAPLVPVGLAASRAWRLGSWDRTVVPKPFARLSLVVGEPIAVSRDLPTSDLRSAATALTVALDRVEEQARRAAARDASAGAEHDV